MKDKKNNIKVGFTTGDMNGVGPEILLKSFRNTELLSICTPVIYGPLKNLNYTLTHLGFEMSFNKISSAEKSKEGKINLVDSFNDAPEITFGALNKEIGYAAFESIKMGVKDLKEGKIDVLVTPPINKEAIHSDDFPFMVSTFN